VANDTDEKQPDTKTTEPSTSTEDSPEAAAAPEEEAKNIEAAASDSAETKNDDVSEDTSKDDKADPEEAQAAEPEKKNDYQSGRAFSDFPLSNGILEGLNAMGYSEATQVQAATIEPGLAGRDLLVRAKTGTGKTCAFCLPMIENIDEGSRKVQGLVLAPTRELASQIAKECAAIARYKDLRILPVYGGVAMGPQTKAIEEGVEIIVGTPGRVLDHIRRGQLDLSTLKAFCLDEADEMLSMGFFEDVSKILDKAPKDSQTLLFSATVEAQVKRLVQRYLRDPVDIMLSTDTDKVEGITNVLYETDPSFHRVRALLAIIDKEEPGSTIVFCNTKEDVATVANFLSRQGLDAQLISGDLPQGKRSQVMEKVKSGEVQYLVATDVAARGIDISDITHVINYALPQDPAVFMHRIGRTGRIGKEGKAISLAGGPELATRKVLERQFDIVFDVKVMPTPEEAGELRLSRQLQAIQKVAGITAFEGFLPLVKALKAREDGDIYLATALRIFFQWQREQRAKESGIDTMAALSESKAQRDGGRRGGRRRDGGGGRRRDGGGPRRDDGPRRDGGQRDDSSGGGRKRRRRRRGGGGGGSRSGGGSEGGGNS